MTIVTEPTMCCGVQEITGIQAEEDFNSLHVLQDVARYFFEWNEEGAHYVFTAATTFPGGLRRGATLARAITKHGLGTVVRSKSAYNPNSRHQVAVWLWTLDKRKFRTFYKEHQEEIHRRHRWWRRELIT